MAPGNAGTQELAINLDINPTDFEAVKKAVLQNAIEMVVVGPEAPLVAGIHDFFLADVTLNHIPVIGPKKEGALLEGSKDFSKKFMQKHGIPTAKYQSFTNDTLENGFEFLETLQPPFVLKADGLAAGKGVTISLSKSESIQCAKEILDGKFKTSKKVVIEEFLEGEEASYFIITDGENYLPIGTAQDHKRIGEGDTGPNTGGMGAYSPSLLINKELQNKINKQIIEPTLKGLNKKGCKFVGILYAGLMIKNNQPKLIEYNIRFGDPECQVLMMRLDVDLLNLILSIKEKKLMSQKISWKKEPGITIVAAAKGYPGAYNTNSEIKNLQKIQTNNTRQIFHAGTINKNGKVLSAGGRVLNATCIGPDLAKARAEAHEMLKILEWDDLYYRKDIGWRVIN